MAYMKIIPVTLGFDLDKPIGMLHIQADMLPAKPNYVFSLGYTVLDGKCEGANLIVDKHELIQVALLSDEQYLAYLEKTKGGF